MKTPAQLKEERRLAVQNVALALERMTAAEMRMDNTMLAARIMEAQQRLQQIETEEAAASRARYEQSVQYRDQQTGQWLGSGPAPDATAQPATDEARIAQVMNEMAAKGHGRI